MIGPKERQKRFDRLAGLAAAAGMEMHVCACKNPDLTISSVLPLSCRRIADILPIMNTPVPAWMG